MDDPSSSSFSSLFLLVSCVLLFIPSLLVSRVCVCCFLCVIFIVVVVVFIFSRVCVSVLLDPSRSGFSLVVFCFSSNKKSDPNSTVCGKTSN